MLRKHVADCPRISVAIATSRMLCWKRERACAHVSRSRHLRQMVFTSHQHPLVSRVQLGGGGLVCIATDQHSPPKVRVEVPVEYIAHVNIACMPAACPPPPPETQAAQAGGPACILDVRTAFRAWL